MSLACTVTADAKQRQETTATHHSRAAKDWLSPAKDDSEGYPRCEPISARRHSVADHIRHQTADSLYQKGYLSYPRTETDQFDKDFDFDEMLQKHTGDARWGAFATSYVTVR